jgi:hypothetical protein
MIIKKHTKKIMNWQLHGKRQRQMKVKIRMSFNNNVSV